MTTCWCLHYAGRLGLGEIELVQQIGTAEIVTTDYEEGTHLNVHFFACEL